MISISAVVSIIFYLVIGGIVFALLWYAIVYCEREFPSAGIFFKIARILLILLAVFAIIGVLLSMVGGAPVFRP